MRIAASEIPLFSRQRVRNQKKTSRIHWHQKHELYYLLKGTTKYLIGEKPYFLQEGNLIFVPKGSFHCTDSENCMTNERLLLCFDDKIIPAAYRKYIDDLTMDNLIYIPEKNLPQISELFLKIEKEFEGNNLHKQHIMELYILEMLVLISRCREKAPKPHLNANDAHLYAISKYIRKNYATNITLESLSEQFSINKSYLSRRFKNVFGIGLNDYLTYIRILHAEHLLRTTNYPITRIAAECGYNDSNYFSTVFKKTKGVTPYKFKKETNYE